MFKELNTLRIFFESPTQEFSVREVARMLKISPATVSKNLNYLAEKNILKGRKERMLNLYKSNIENEFYKDLKIFYTIRKIKTSGFFEALNRFYLKPTIVLFGSASLGSDTETSDLDILVISEKTKEFPKLKKFEKKINRKIQLFVFSAIKKIRNKHFINNILNGLVLQGELKWI